MKTRGFATVAVLSTTAGVLLGAFLLGGRHGRPAAAEPAVRSASGIPGPPDWAQKVLAKDASGQWLVSWDQIARHVSAYTFEPRLGEQNHSLQGPQPVTASIAPVADVWLLDQIKLFPGHIIARIESSDAYTSLGLVKGFNYLFVWQSGKTRRLAVLNDLGRTEVKLQYTRHGDVSRDLAGKILANKARNPGRLSFAALTCISKGWKACFVDSRKIQAIGSDGAPGMMGLMDRQGGGGGSQPWVSCVLLGCCCGGSNCHN